MSQLTLAVSFALVFLVHSYYEFCILFLKCNSWDDKQYNHLTDDELKLTWSNLQAYNMVSRGPLEI